MAFDSELLTERELRFVKTTRACQAGSYTIRNPDPMELLKTICVQRRALQAIAGGGQPANAEIARAALREGNRP